MTLPHREPGRLVMVTPSAPHERDPLGLICLALQSDAHAVLVTGTESTILFASRAASLLLAFEAGELEGQRISSVLPDAFSDPIAAIAAPGTGLQEALQKQFAVRKDGIKVPVRLDRDVVMCGGTRYTVASLTDMTDRLNLEARLAAATNEQLGFHRLISDLATRLASVDADALEATIVAGLTQIGEVLQLQRATVWRWEVGETVARPWCFWQEPGLPSPPPPLPIASVPFMMSMLEAGETVRFTTPGELPDPIDRATAEQRGVRSGLALPLFRDAEDGVQYVLSFTSMTAEREWVPAVIERLRLVAGLISVALAHRASQAGLQRALDELQRRDRRAEPALELRRDFKHVGTSRIIVSESSVVRQALVQVEQVAPTPATVLLMGETGTGKEVFAQTIHDLSPRHRRPMVVVSCAAIPAALIESELFGRERGAYTGALSRQIGRFEAAHQSTLFLDEIGELSPEMQVKLLRVLQERVIERLGSTQPIKIDVRIIAATHRNLEKAVQEGQFREDLFYRLNVFPITVPPLRERIEDVPGLVWAFVDEFSRLFGKTIDSISKESMRQLQGYAWPGNVRELRNVIERAVILSASRQLEVAAPARAASAAPATAMTLSAVEVEHIRSVLESTRWRVRGPGGAAERLGLKPTTLESRMARLGITRTKVS
jgi:PAS domain S-box-containing protein